MALEAGSAGGELKGGRVDMAHSNDKKRDVEHFDFGQDESPTVHTIGVISFGGEAVIEEVRVEDTFFRAPFVCVRRSYIGLSKQGFKGLKTHHEKEIAILKRLRNRRHFIQLVGSYTKDAKSPRDLALVILQNPRADCDLASLLDKTPEERRSLLSDSNLVKGLGCLASALYFLHSSRIRHKDIASKNVLIHGEDLLFADFGLSTDFSELTNSATSGAVRQQGAYRPPEAKAGRKHSCASDVFSLGCVFFEVLASLLQREDGFCHLRPYHDHLNHIYSWLESTWGHMDRVEENRPLLLVFWLKKTHQMMTRSMDGRPKMFDIVLELKDLKQEFISGGEKYGAKACDFCMENFIQTLNPCLPNEPIMIGFEEIVQGAALHHESSATDQAGTTSGIGSFTIECAKSMLLSSGLLKRWHLTFWLDNGRQLRAYGTWVTGNIDMKFDFGDMLIQRVVFEAGSYGKLVTLYKDKTVPEKHGFKSGPCDQVFPEGITVWRYKVTGEEKS